MNQAVSVPANLREEAEACALNAIDKMPRRALGGKSMYENRTGRKPQLHKLHSYGARAVVALQDTDRRRGANRGALGYHLGQATGGDDGWRFFMPKTKTIVTSRSVRFYDNEFQEKPAANDTDGVLGEGAGHDIQEPKQESLAEGLLEARALEPAEEKLEARVPEEQGSAPEDVERKSVRVRARPFRMEPGMWEAARKHDAEAMLQANMAAGLIGGLTTATATMRSIANIQCGARTILSTVVHGCVLLALVLGLAPLASYIPMGCLAAILFKVGYDILDFRVFPILHRIPTPAKITFWTVFLLTVWEDLLVAVGVGLAIAFFLFVRDMSEMWKPKVVGLEESKKSGSERVPIHLRKLIAVLEPNGPMFFGIADTLYRQVDKLTHYQVLIISLIHVPMVDLSGAFALEDMANQAQKNGTKVLIKGMNPAVKRTLNELSVIEHIGKENFVENFDAALKEGIDYIGEQFLGRDIAPKTA
jgi:ABC-type transporter Mla MlaB component